MIKADLRTWTWRQRLCVNSLLSAKSFATSPALDVVIHWLMWGCAPGMQGRRVSSSLKVTKTWTPSWDQTGFTNQHETWSIWSIHHCFIEKTNMKVRQILPYACRAPWYHWDDAPNRRQKCSIPRGHPPEAHWRVVGKNWFNKPTHPASWGVADGSKRMA